MIVPLTLALASFVPLQDPEPSEEEKGFSGSFDLGIIVLDGNNESFTGAANARAKYRAEDYQVLANAGYYGNRQEDRSTGDSMTSQRLYFANAEYNRFLDEEENLYAYGNAGAQKNDPGGLQFRGNTGVGAGYSFKWFEETTILGVEAGPSWVKENNTGVASTDYFAGRLAANLESELATDLSLQGSGAFLQSFDDTDDQVFSGEIGLRYNLSETWFAQATAGMIWDNTPAPGFSKTDTRYILGVGATF